MKKLVQPWRSLSLLTVAAATAPLVCQAAAEPYSIKNLGASLGARSYAHGINHLGQVVGYWDTGTNGFHGFLYSFGSWTDLGALGGTNSYALSINGAGEVVGFAEGVDGLHAFHYRDGFLFDLGALGGHNSYAFGINSAGQIVGYIDTAKGARAFLYENGVLWSLGTLGGSNSYAFGINTAAQVVGTSDTKGSTPARAFLWQNGQLINLNEFLFPDSGWTLLEARGINERGAIVGWGLLNGRERAFLFEDGAVTDLGWLAGATNSFAHGLNGVNAVVGACEFADGSMRPFLWEQGALWDLNALVTDGSGWDLREARGINDRGQIVGWGVIHGQEHAFLLTPLSVASAGERAKARVALASGGGSAVTNTPLADAHVVGAAPNSNFGLATLLEVQTTAAGTNRDAYFKFSIANAPMPISSAKLRLYALLSASGNVTSTVYSVTDTNWTETAITWNTRPALVSALTNRAFSGTKGAFYEIDLTSYLRSEQAAGRALVALALHNSNNSIPFVKINSKENTKNKPQLVLWPNTAPAVSITSPTNFASFRAPTNLTLTATATDTNGTVVSVEFYAGDQLLGTDAASPYSVVWSGAPVGVHALTARATDDLGVVRTSAVVTISVTTNLVAIADAHVTSASPTVNFGTNTLLEVQTNGASGPTRDTYLKFNIAGVGNIATAQLRLWASASGSSTCSGTAYTVADTTWVETNITWNTRPALGTALGHMRVTSTTPSWFEIDVSNYLRAEQTAGRQLISLAIHSQTNNSKFIKINSREAVSNRVELALVTTNALPAVALTAPPPNSLYQPPAEITVTADAVDADGSVVQVEFFAGALSLGVDSVPPYSVNWAAVGTGSYALTARATDNSGAVATSSVVNVVVDPPPLITLTTPTNGALFPTPANFALSAEASDNDAIAQVEFFDGPSSLGIVATAPFTLPLSNVAIGSHSYSAQATDNYGQKATSSVATVQVAARPEVTLVEPTEGASYSWPTNVTFVATASDSDGTIARVEFFAGNFFVGSATSEPFAVSWANALPGSYSVVAVATDSEGLRATSAPVNITIEFLATDLGGLKLWLDAGTGLVTDASGLISSWNDQSGNGLHGTQSSATARPQPVDEILNGRPVVRFDGTDDYLILPPATFSGVTEAEAFLVVKASADLPSTPRQLWFVGGIGSAVYYPDTAGNVSETFGSTTAKAVGNPAQPLDQFHLYNVSAAAGQWAARFNGLTQAQTTNNTVGFWGSFPGPTISSSSSTPFAGDIAEILIFNRVLSAAERDVVGAYLNGRYALVSPPAAPVNLVAQGFSATQISLHWDSPLTNQQVLFDIERKDVGAFALVATVDSTSSWVDPAVVAGTTYTYRVRARNYAGQTDYSNEAQAAPVAGEAALPLNEMVVWLRADAGLAGGAVSSWIDQSGRGNHAVQATAAQAPAAVPNAVNGRPVVRFDGANDHLILPPPTFSGVTQAEAFVVVKASADVPATSRQLWFVGGIGSAVYYPDTAGNVSETFGSTTAKAVGNPAQPLDQFHLYNVSAAAGQWAARFNGLTQAQTTNNTVGFWGSFPGPTIGTSSGSFAGDIAEILIFSRVLSAAERFAVGSYVNAKFSLTPGPLTPSNLAATALSSNQVNLTWAAAILTNQTRFAVERKQGPAGAYALVAMVDNVASYLDTGLSEGTEYFYRVKARNYAGESGYSGEAAATTPAGVTAFPLSGLQLWLKADGQVYTDASGRVLNWRDQSGVGNDAQQSGADNQPQLVLDSGNGRPVLRFDGTNDLLNADATPATNDFTVLAVARPTLGHEIDAEGLSGGPGASGQRYLIGEFRLDFQGYDRGLASLSLGTNGLSAYEYQRVISGADQIPALAVHRGATGPGPALVTLRYTARQPSIYLNGALVRVGLTSVRSNVFAPGQIGGTTYTLQTNYFGGDIAEILVYDGSLDETQRSAAERYLNARHGIVTVLPATPANLAATAFSSSQIHLVWTPAADSPASLKLERKQGAAGAYQEIATLAGSVSSFFDNGLGPGTEYFYRVKAANLLGDSPYSTEAGATTPTGGVDFPITKLRLWLKADGAMSRDELGQVSHWYDLSLDANHAGQFDVAKLPLFLTNQANGRPVVRFDGTEDQLVCPRIPATNDFEVFAVARPLVAHQIDLEGGTGDGEAGQRYLLDPKSILQGQEVASAGLSLGTNGISVYEFQYNQVGSSFLPAVAVAPEPVMDRFFVASFTHTLRQPNIYGNGRLLRQGLTYSRQPVYAPHRLGSGDSQTFSGDVAEVLIFDRVLTDAERDAVGVYFNQRSAILTEPPPAPTGLLAQAISPIQLELSWDPAPTAITYTIERKEGVSGAYTLLAVVRDATSYLDASVVAGTHYFYRIKAWNYFGDSAWSAEVSPPTSLLTSPLSHVIVSVGSNVLASADATDLDGTIASVEFYLDGLLAATDLTSPYTTTLTSLTAGSHVLLAKAIDNQGHSRFSPPSVLLLPPDSDGDGLNDFDEITAGTNPFGTDTDGDGVADPLDAFPLDPARSQPPSPTPGDTTPPDIFLDEPPAATPLP